MKFVSGCLAIGFFGLAIPSQAEEPTPIVPAGMALIRGGEFTPQYAKEARQRRTAAFLLGVTPVTNAQFLAFVTVHPEWRRSKVTRAQADENYLRHWAADLDLGPAADTARLAPVTHVSWYAARAFCEAHGQRLPTQDEWEFTARADATRLDASTDQAFLRRLLEWYAKPATGVPPAVETAELNVYGVRGLHGLVWEWVHDFNSAIVVGDSRGDGSLERKLFCGAGSLLASDVTNYAAFMRYAFRSSLKGNYCVGSLGFRVAQSTSPDSIPRALATTPVASPYDLAGRWQTERGQEIALPSLRGKVRVFTMGFTSCQYACPRIVGDIQRIESALGPDAAKVGFVFASIDPKRDTPLKLSAFATERKLDPGRWTLLSGTVEGVRDLSVAMGFKYQQVGEDFGHSNLIAVVSADGRIIHREEALDANLAPIVSAIRKGLTMP
jgi:formylglycine-generating enzyme required for sulfatase activity